MNLDDVESIMLETDEVVKLQIGSTVIWEKEATKTLTNLRVENTGSFVTTQYTNHDVNIAGLRIVAEFSDGSESTLTSGYTYNPHTWTEAGSKTIEFSYTYSGVTKSANSPTVTVLVDSVNSISVDGSWGSGTQYVGQTITLSDYFTVNAHYASGDVTPVTGYTYIPTQWTSAGSQCVTVTYSGKTAYTPYVTVEESAIEYVYCASGSSWSHTQYAGQSVDTTGITLKAHRTYGSDTEVPITSTDPATWSSIGWQTCDLYYNTYHCTSPSVNVMGATMHIYVVADPAAGGSPTTDKSTYTEGTATVAYITRHTSTGYRYKTYSISKTSGDVSFDPDTGKLTIYSNCRGDVTVTLVFEQIITRNIYVVANPTSAGNPTSNKSTYNEGTGTTATITLNANPGFKYGSHTISKTSGSATFDPDTRQLTIDTDCRGDVTLQINYADATKYVGFYAHPSGCCNPSGDSYYYIEGTAKTINVTFDDLEVGYEYKSYTVDVSEGTVTFDRYTNKLNIGADCKGPINVSFTFEDTLKPVGGRIFYYSGASGYTFYNLIRQEITDTSLAGLAGAKYYKKTSSIPGTNVLVYDSVNGLTPTATYYWGWYQTLIGANTTGIGGGYYNTAKVLAKGIPTDYTPNMWQYITDINSANTGGCNDWYIGNKDEMEQLRLSGLVNWFDESEDKYPGTSSEADADSFYYWYPGSYARGWHTDLKKTKPHLVAIRMF